MSFESMQRRMLLSWLCGAYVPAARAIAHGDESALLRLAQSFPPRTTGQSCEAERIVKIDALSDDLALAQVHVQIHDKLFADNLNFVKIEGQWMIVAKIYHLIGAAL